jgi:hypothetical protein
MTMQPPGSALGVIETEFFLELLVSLFPTGPSQRTAFTDEPNLVAGESQLSPLDGI